MTVFIVWIWDYDNSGIDSIHLRRESADARIKELTPDENSLEVREMEVIE